MDDQNEEMVLVPRSWANEAAGLMGLGIPEWPECNLRPVKGTGMIKVCTGPSNMSEANVLR